MNDERDLVMVRKMLHEIDRDDLADDVRFENGIAWFDRALTADEIKLLGPVLAGALKPITVGESE